MSAGSEFEENNSYRSEADYEYEQNCMVVTEVVE